jgi:hypothetical protein
METSSKKQASLKWTNIANVPRTKSGKKLPAVQAFFVNFVTSRHTEGMTRKPYSSLDEVTAEITTGDHSPMTASTKEYAYVAIRIGSLIRY